MATETVQTTTSKQPGKQEFKEEVKKETDDGSRYESTTEVKVETKSVPDAEAAYSRIARGEAIIQRNVLWAVGAGIIPVPIVDFVAVTGVQLKMVKELSDVYEVPFKSHIVKKLVYTLLSGFASIGIGNAV